MNKINETRRSAIPIEDEDIIQPVDSAILPFHSGVCKKKEKRAKENEGRKRWWEKKKRWRNEE